jgi:Arc/MetJ family transcription regulator
MATEKVSLTLDEELVSEARGTAGMGGLSGYVNLALRRQLQRDRLSRLLDDMDQEFGPIDPRATAAVSRAWPAPAARSVRRRRG